MKRRDFLKMTSALPVGLSMSGLAQKAYAASPIYSNVSVTAPAVMPQVINIFMYGGASELAGNLSNIADINMHSQNDYSDGNAFRETILQAATDNDPNNRNRFQDGQITTNSFWKEAGGTHMEDMLAANDMTVYRTIFKQVNATRSHRDSIFMSHKGTLDIENSPGIGSRLALMLLQNKSSYEGIASLGDGTTITNIEELTLPFVSFEGDTQTYALDPENTIPLQFRGLTMDSSFNNPYSRNLGRYSGDSEDFIQSLVTSRLQAIESNRTQYSSAWDGFEKRAELESKMADLDALLDDTTGSATSLGITYPNTSFARQLEAAVTLAIHNPETLYMAVGTPGLGGWDDHNNGIDRYANRMNDLMEAIKVAMSHIKAAEGVSETIGGNTRTDTGNIIINVFGDFGRLVNLNGSGGWDHANNQNLYTFGGASVRPANEAAKLGQVVGVTRREGTSKTNNQYTVPVVSAQDPTWEPMSVASSIYQYFGATNSPILTADPMNLDGFETFSDKLPSIT
ncbi:hypothetical protein NBRC116188_10280 [Oceaniserpentilla sp. 4NH20-0058]|uniref:DUF1501 domain-containing protein n=1 Tax=Oceaniserpentilla sp. 4NH20-0058 TaxID=3127660 RepID=UPI00310547DD